MVLWSCLIVWFSPAMVLADEDARKFEHVTVRGKVVWLNEALHRLHGVRTVREAAERSLALETRDGELHPLLEDLRGRAFRLDPRLRGVTMELLARRHAGSPMLQVIKVFVIEEDGTFELDYWCDVCAISMYELKPCDCCQGESRLRRRRR